MNILPKKIVIIFLSIFAVLLILVIADKVKMTRTSQSDRIVKYVSINYRDSWHDNEYVYFKNSVEWSNYNDKDLWGYVYASIPNGNEEILYAYDADTGEKELIHIKANTRTVTVLTFRGSWLGEYSKSARCEPIDIVFEAVDINDVN